MSAEKSDCYQCKAGLLPGHNYSTIIKIVRRIFNTVTTKTKRRPYVRSAYFGGKKVFFDYFWPHLFEKNLKDRFRRLKFFRAALELIKNSKHKPILERRNEPAHIIFYRFLGECSGQRFIVQIKQDLKREQKFFMSVFGINEK